MREPKLTLSDRFTVAPIRNYIILGLACLLLYYMVISANSSIAAVIVCLVGVAGLFLNWIGFAVIFLVLNFWTTFLPDFGLFSTPSGGGNRRDFERMSVLDLQNLIQNAAVLGYLMATLRVQALAHRALPPEPATVVGRLRERETRLEDGDNPSMKAVFLSPRRPVWLVKELELVAVALTGVAALFGGMLAYLGLNALTKKVDFAAKYDMAIGAARLLTLIWAGIFGVLIALALLYIFTRRQMTAKVARVVLLDMFYSETRREVERQNTWREWFRARRERRR